MGSRVRVALLTVAVVLIVSVGTALAAAPGVLYGDPTNVTQSGVVLQGSVNPSDKPTTYYFDYGASTGYGTATAQATLPKSKAWQAVSAAITGLSAGSTYHYRIVAWNGGGTKDKTIGSDHTFTTASAPDPPGDLSPSPDDPTLGGIHPDNGADASPAEGLRPTLGASVVVRAVAGRVLIRRPGSGSFARLTTGAEVPVESQIDATNARIALTSELPDGRTQTGRFGGGTLPAAPGSPGLPRPLPPRSSLPEVSPARAGRVGLGWFRAEAAPQPSVGAPTMADASEPTVATVRRPCAERAGLWRIAATAAHRLTKGLSSFETPPSSAAGAPCRRAVPRPVSSAVGVVGYGILSGITRGAKISVASNVTSHRLTLAVAGASGAAGHSHAPAERHSATPVNHDMVERSAGAVEIGLQQR